MTRVNAFGFETFAAEFVRAFWETVKSGEFSMPPNEPVEETVRHMLAAVSHEIKIDSPCTGSTAVFELRMSGLSGDWWDFRFQEAADGWSLVDAAARSDDDTKPHDLLDAVYGPFFEPFLRHVAEIANKRTGT